LRYPDAKTFDGLILWGEGGMDGPRVPPGTYNLRLTVGDVARNTTARLIQDPREKASSADLQSQFEFLLASNRKLTQVHEEIGNIRNVLGQLRQLRKRIGNDEKSNAVLDAAKQLASRVTAIEETLYQTQNRSPHDPLNFPIRLNNKLATLTASVAVGDHAPTAQQLAYQTVLVGKIDAALAKLGEIWAKDLPAFNQMVQQSFVPAIQLEAAAQ
jgi:hypothetical protein